MKVYTKAERISRLIQIDVVDQIEPCITKLQMQPGAITRKFNTILDGDELSLKFLQLFHKLCLFEEFTPNTEVVFCRYVILLG